MTAPPAARLRSTVDEVVAALLVGCERLPPDGTLARGTAGLAVAFAHLARDGRAECEAACARCLDHAVEQMAQARLGPSLLTGFPGVAWAVAHVAALDREPVGDMLADVDEALLTWVKDHPEPLPFDLTVGLAGVGVYGLERLPDPAGRQLLEAVVARLADVSDTGPRGRSWWTGPALLHPAWRAKFPSGRLDLGMAHGAAGVIALLAAACAAGVAEAGDLLPGAVATLLACGDGGHFPAWTAVEADTVPPRLAWCYGDLGTAAALVGAGRAAAMPEWEQAGVAVARGAAARPLEDSGVIDAGLCHGAAGVAHLFGWMADATGDRVLQEAAGTWRAHALGVRREQGGVAGYLAWSSPGAEPPRWRADPGLLDGAAGVALALQAATGESDAGWDRLFLPAVPAAALAAAPGTSAGAADG